MYTQTVSAPFSHPNAEDVKTKKGYLLPDGPFLIFGRSGLLVIHTFSTNRVGHCKTLENLEN